MVKRERTRVYLDDLLDDWVTRQERPDLVGYEVVAVYDTAGNKVSKAEELEIVYEIEWVESVDKSEQTPKQENDWLREAGF